MRALVVYESVYGNTRAIAEAVAGVLGPLEAVPVQHAPGDLADVELLVVGGPTHMHGLSTATSRRMAVQGAAEEGHHAVEPDAAGEPGLRRWLHDLPARPGLAAAAFDTRLDRAPVITGRAAHGIARRLRSHGFAVLGTASFQVEDSEGPLEAGEIERARGWAGDLARSPRTLAPQR